MAGKYIEILNPGYATLWTRDVGYTPGQGEASDLNPFDPNGDRPLVEGEFLEFEGTSSSGLKVTRGGLNAVSAGDAPANEADGPSFMHFMEKGRYDMQTRKMAHIVTGPQGFEFRTKLCRSSGLSVNSAVGVFDWAGTVASPLGMVRRVLALSAGGHTCGYVTRIYGTNDIGIFWAL